MINILKWIVGFSRTTPLINNFQSKYATGSVYQLPNGEIFWFVGHINGGKELVCCLFAQFTLNSNSFVLKKHILPLQKLEGAKQVPTKLNLSNTQISNQLNLSEIKADSLVLAREYYKQTFLLGFVLEVGEEAATVFIFDKMYNPNQSIAFLPHSELLPFYDSRSFAFVTFEFETGPTELPMINTYQLLDE